ncbi:molybdate ABC transporter substrate-binding protein [Bacillus dakarensis]|uniref:molybdate ABC transporter substrate-binding protein n=1 Tax=Robertmurraya dakarensis TaxID=1926278 RepID=UPI000980BB16|nr:molybdate ABC transporter substrate-binding protein [Bacillus dakarensis]
MKYISLKISLLLILAFLAGCSNDSPQDSNEEITLTVSAAASLNEALTEIKAIYEEENDSVELVLNFGGSGSLQQQIKQGAPVDIFISAAEQPFAELVSNDLIDQSNQTELIGNSLVLIAPMDSNLAAIEELTKSSVKKVAVGTTDTVPAGHYAKQSLLSIDQWESISKKTVFTKDVRQVLTYVETGNVDAGFVYKTDAQASEKVKIVTELADDSHDPIVYPAGVVKASKNHEHAVLFYHYLQTNNVQKIFEKYGFRVWKR